MENVLNAAEQLAEAILESEEYIRMRIAEQAAMRDEGAAALVEGYNQSRTAIENMLASNDLNHAALAEASERLKAAEAAMDDNALIQAMREGSAVFAEMMKKVNQIIKYVVTGEPEEEESGCSGSCAGCGGGCQH